MADPANPFRVVNPETGAELVLLDGAPFPTRRAQLDVDEDGADLSLYDQSGVEDVARLSSAGDRGYLGASSEQGGTAFLGFEL